ncbi:TGS domain-containing protein [Rhodopseudomonas sp. BR0C11]|nr:TGS domain-containing protein [Rhodopseudomonas sp. BR0C11]
MTEFSQDLLTQRIRAVRFCASDKLDDLVRVTGLNPAKDLRYGDFTAFNFTDLDLRGFNFAGADLRGVCFDGAMIKGANFSRAKVSIRQLSRASDFGSVPVRSYGAVLCKTPKGGRIILPIGATSIDFAYAVHTEVGNSAVGCKINGKFAPLSMELEDGDEVELLTSRGHATPPAAWESLAITGKARTAIRRATRFAMRDQYCGLGRRIVERLFRRAGIDYSEERLLGALPWLARGSIDEVMASVGRGEMKASDVARAMYPDYREEHIARFGAKKDLSEKGLLDFAERGRSGVAIPIGGVYSSLPVKFAPIGGAVPGDRIVGIVTPGEGITVYPIQSAALKEFEDAPERWLDVRWNIDETSPQLFLARLFVQYFNEPNGLAQITSVIAEHHGNIENVNMARHSPDIIDLTIDLGVFDLKHLSGIIAQLRVREVVASVNRVDG